METQRYEEEWGSVRKVRTVSELEDLFSLVPTKSFISFEDLRKRLVQNRIKSADIRLGTSRRRERGLSALHQDQNSLRALTKDRVAFARGIGVWYEEADRIYLTDLGRRVKVDLEKETSKNAVLLRLLLDSKYRVYLSFFRKMCELKGRFSIPHRYASRVKTSGAREFLQSKGFKTDVPSFHTTKEMLYDFDILNWRVIPKSKDEEIFLTRDLYEYEQIDKVRLALQDSYWEMNSSPVSEEDFVQTLNNSFHSLGLDRGSYYDILSVRDETCARLRISDRSFGKLLQEAVKGAEKDRLLVGVGPFIEQIPAGYGTKLRTLPSIFEGEPITKVMVT